MVTCQLFDLIERNIFVRDGMMVWESILERYVSPDDLSYILSLVADHIGQDDVIAWADVRKEFRIWKGKETYAIGMR